MTHVPGDLITKDPQSIEPQGFDWTAYLTELTGTVTISTSTWSVSPSGLTLGSPTIVTGNLKTQVKLSGGTASVRYTVTNHIVASDGTEDDRSFLVWVQNK